MQTGNYIFKFSIPLFAHRKQLGSVVLLVLSVVLSTSGLLATDANHIWWLSSASALAFFLALPGMGDPEVDKNPGMSKAEEDRRVEDVISPIITTRFARKKAANQNSSSSAA